MCALLWNFFRTQSCVLRLRGTPRMIDRLIELSLRNRFLVVALWIGIAGWGLWAMLRAPIDAIPDLSDNQVIVFTDWSGRSPQEVEDQVTYPLTVNLQGLAGRQSRALFFGVRVFHDLRHLRRQRGSLLRAHPRSRTIESRHQTTSARRCSHARTRMRPVSATSSGTPSKAVDSACAISVRCRIGTFAIN